MEALARQIGLDEVPTLDRASGMSVVGLTVSKAPALFPRVEPVWATQDRE